MRESAMRVGGGVIAGISVAEIRRVSAMFIGMVGSLGEMRRSVPGAANLSDGWRGDGERQQNRDDERNCSPDQQ